MQFIAIEEVARLKSTLTTRYLSAAVDQVDDIRNVQATSFGIGTVNR